MGNLLEKLSEGTVQRNLRREGEAVVKKWEDTGLLEGLQTYREKSNMAVMMETQVKELIREASAMSAGDVEGFASVAFPIVRRVFGSLIANDLVSVQPMSLPSSLIFFLDFTFEADKSHAGAVADESVFGGGKVGKGISEGISLTGSEAEKGFYALNQGYSSPSGSKTANVSTNPIAGDNDWNYNVWTDHETSGALGGSGTDFVRGDLISGSTDQKLVRHDIDVLEDSSAFYALVQIRLDSDTWDRISFDNLVACNLTEGTSGEMSGATVVRRLTEVSSSSTRTLNMVLRSTTDGSFPSSSSVNLTFNYAHKDQFTTGADSTALGSLRGTAEWYLEFETTDFHNIPEIDIKIDSIGIQAETKKLKAKWTPELGQDLDAYHNLDAEVELTGILSEHIALEIDRLLLNDLLKGATADVQYWSRQPGKFVVRSTGVPIDGTPASLSAYPDFTGNVSEWYETLIETINDVSAEIHRKVLKGGANFLVVSPKVANILEFTSGFRANITHDDNKGTVGGVNAGSMNKKWDVWVDPYWPQNVILVGRKGSSFLESGYVYAPYVPLQITPTIFDPEKFTPRKGVLTRFGRKMVRPDMYGLVIVADLYGGSQQ